jgi:hypothetical protein
MQGALKLPLHTMLCPLCVCLCTCVSVSVCACARVHVCIYLYVRSFLTNASGHFVSFSLHGTADQVKHRNYFVSFFLHGTTDQVKHSANESVVHNLFARPCDYSTLLARRVKVHFVTKDLIVVCLVFAICK